MSRRGMAFSLLSVGAAWLVTIGAATLTLEHLDGAPFTLMAISSAVACGTLILGCGGPLVAVWGRADTSGAALRWGAVGLVTGAAIAVMGHQAVFDLRTQEDLLFRDRHTSSLLGTQRGLLAHLPVLAGGVVFVVMSLPSFRFLARRGSGTDAG